MKPFIENRLSYSDRLQLIGGYSLFVKDLIKSGSIGHLITLMFNPLPGSLSAKLRQMRSATERAFYTFQTRVVRKPHSREWGHKRPHLIACPDLPVRKQQKQSISDVSINDGWHIHGILIVPRESRLDVPVQTHFSTKQALYRGRVQGLARIEAQCIDENIEGAVDYVLKTLKRGKVDADELIIL